MKLQQMKFHLLPMERNIILTNYVTTSKCTPCCMACCMKEKCLSMGIALSPAASSCEARCEMEQGGFLLLLVHRYISHRLRNEDKLPVTCHDGGPFLDPIPWGRQDHAYWKKPSKQKPTRGHFRVSWWLWYSLVMKFDIRLVDWSCHTARWCNEYDKLWQ